MTRPFFSKDRIGHFDIFERHADDAIQQAKVRIHAGYAVDFQVPFNITNLSHDLTLLPTGYDLQVHT